MKKVTVKNNAGEDVGNLGPTESPEAWIAGCVASNAWGLPERLVLHKDEPMAQGYDEADVIGEEVREVSPAIEAKDAVLDAEGIILEPAIEAVPAVTRKLVRLRAQYTIEITDISAEYELQKCIAARIAEYPSAGDFLNAYFDGGEAALAALKEKRLLIKQKFPKPQ